MSQTLKVLFLLFLHREEKLKIFIELLEQDSIGADDRITTKIEWLARAAEYCHREKLLPSQDYTSLSLTDCQPGNTLSLGKSPPCRQKEAFSSKD